MQALRYGSVLSWNARGKPFCVCVCVCFFGVGWGVPTKKTVVIPRSCSKFWDDFSAHRCKRLAGCMGQCSKGPNGMYSEPWLCSRGRALEMRQPELLVGKPCFLTLPSTVVYFKYNAMVRITRQ